MREGAGRAGRLIPSPAMVVAVLALFVALGGSAWAVSKVGTKQLKNKAVTTAKLGNGAVSGPKIRAGAVNGSRLAERAVTGPKLAPGAVGTGALADQSVTAAKIASGTLGPDQLQPGAVGTDALADQSVTAAKIADGAVGGSKLAVSAVNGQPVSIPAGSSAPATAICPGNKTAISAGFQANTSTVVVYQLQVVGNTANVFAANPAGSPEPVQVTAQAVCV